MGGTKREWFVTGTRISNSAKMAAALGTFFAYKTVVSSYRSNNTH